MEEETLPPEDAPAGRSSEAGRDDPETLWMAASTIGALAGEYATVMAAIDRALAVNPNCASAWSARGCVTADRCTARRTLEAAPDP